MFLDLSLQLFLVPFHLKNAFNSHATCPWHRRKQSMLKKRYIISTVFIIILILISNLFFFGYRESTVNAGFPVPKSAELVKENMENMNEEFHWRYASEENGLPYFYKAVIRGWGWKKESQEGSHTVYEKEGRKVYVISQTDYLFISKED
jgi:hypothetical protein